MSDKAQSDDTILAHGFGMMDEQHLGVIPGIYPSTTFERAADNSYPNGKVYTRDHNPNYEQPERVLSALEKGADAMLFSSGMSAAVCVFMTLKPGDHVIAPKVMYWSLRNWLTGFAKDWGITTTFVENGDIKALEEAVIANKTKLLWLETPANPTWQIDDIAQWARVAKQANARLAVDNTVATPLLCNPLELGADIVMHSATKYLNGHSDVLAGALVCKEADEHWSAMQSFRQSSGTVLGPFEAWLLMRGMRTLAIRIKQASANALAFANHFEQHPLIEEVLYPGLESFAGHHIAKKQMKNAFGAMLSIRVKGGEQAAIKTAAQLHIFKRATSLGGVESLVEHRASVEGPDTPCPTDLLRLSIGIEGVEDLINDMNQALANI
ncbi:PLP-dependent aspartate aminotransferase family protein [Gammaproteobacteria bacterium AS21]|jgi:cystathionine gamma-synthase